MATIMSETNVQILSQS